ncbi:Mannose-6-phosphate isomerase, cupin superfamily [Flavobacterium fluvii]|uniref:Mannose-6-phosphate isomerase, cupin superfamily n=1 Tax=Flavobacterium fluvii TaxID=468056 RepID=A0A1M5M1E0_9FLAO|nr:cupin domain-containing protein [Flavobacterium fluvii]SHG71174.1 Mannose-6-phosphate isomerase, cupin superfamily [Flavobacterium fluvii]
MKKPILMMLSVILFMATVQKGIAQEKVEKWPGVTIKVLTDNDKVNVSEVTFNPGAVAEWHSHPQYAVYAVTNIKMKVEIKDKEPVVVELKAGQAMYSPAVTHQTTNVGKKPFTAIVTEMK